MGSENEKRGVEIEELEEGSGIVGRGVWGMGKVVQEEGNRK